MAVKPVQDKTKKYSGVVKSVQNSKQPEEPRITSEQVIAAFRSFGFEPNERNHNDVGYWTTRGQSEGVKLMEELHKRRMEINQKEDDNKKNEETKKKSIEESKETLPRLSDEEINALFDEYGLPAPDPEWARNHLPNDPKGIRVMLKMQRKMADDILKKESKNTVTAIPETPKMGTPMMPPPAQQPMMGMGGPNLMGGQEETSATPFFVGDNAIVRITNPNNPNMSTTWLVDAKRKVLRPFASEGAFRNAFENPEEAEKSVITLSSKELGPGGALDGFKPLQSKQGVNDDGSMEDIEFSPAQIQRRYGKQSDSNAENRALSMLDGVFGNLGAPQGNSSPN